MAAGAALLQLHMVLLNDTLLPLLLSVATVGGQQLRGRIQL
jgi:hypothetical protein